MPRTFESLSEDASRFVVECIPDDRLPAITPSQRAIRSDVNYCSTHTEERQQIIEGHAVPGNRSSAIVSSVLNCSKAFPFIKTMDRDMSIQDERLYAGDLVEAADESLKQLGIRDILFEYENGTLFLRGEVPSYYHKQRIQEAVIRLKGVTEVRNEVEVIRAKPR